MLQIKIADVKDALVIASLGKVTFSETFFDYFDKKTDLPNYLDDTFSVEKIKKSLEKKNNIFWLVTFNKLPVAYAKLKKDSFVAVIDDKNICQLQKIYVLKDFHSMNIGYLLQEELLKEASNLKYNQIWLLVYKNNEKAICFYEKNNFNKIGEQPFQIGSQVFSFFIMSKKLS